MCSEGGRGVRVLAAGAHLPVDAACWMYASDVRNVRDVLVCVSPTVIPSACRGFNAVSVLSGTSYM